MLVNDDVTEDGHVLIRPHSIDLLFLRSFPDPFERVERDKNKNKGEKRQKIA